MVAKKSNVSKVVLLGGVVVLAILVAGTIWTGKSASEDTQEAARTVSMLYLDELAERREQVVAANLSSSVRNLYAAVDLMSDEDLQDIEHMQEYQSRMKKLYELDKFAFVDEDGTIYTSLGKQNNIEDYKFNYKTLEEPEISVLDEQGSNKKVIIAIPVSGLSIEGHELVSCFMEIDMTRMLQGVSMEKNNSDSTFANMYTSQGVPLTNMVLGGMATEDNLFDALSHAQFVDATSVAEVQRDFAEGHEGSATYTYNGVLFTLDYVPVEGTNWMLTYLLRDNVISDQISSITGSIITRSLIQSLLAAAVLLGLFGLVISQMRKNAQLTLEKETSEAENRVKREELEHRLELQEQLLQQEKLRAQQDKMITALASDYRSVYYVDLDADEAICYRTDNKLSESIGEGDSFSFCEVFAKYAKEHVAEGYRDEFVRFVDPDSIRRRLENAPLIAFRYLAVHNGQEIFEMLRMAGVRHVEERDDHMVHAVGVGFSDIDAEMRDSMGKNQALSDALAAAEEANRAKTAFLSNMSHEIRTPMNAIIGLDSIALKDDIPADTREYLEKIGESAEHLLSLINDILDMSRIESGSMSIKNEEFALSRLLEQLNTMFSNQCDERGIVYQCNLKGQVDGYYIGDDMKLRQVLINILGNAVKFTPEGGSVTLTVEPVAHFNGKSTLQFEVSDTGIGMSEEFLPHIFDTFSQEDSSSTNKYGSSGLGMAISKSIVEMMNGNIQVRSKKGEGTTFTVTVTLLEADHNAAGISEVELVPSEMSVLIVDDDPVACEHAKLVLENVGISAEVAQSGSQAVDMVSLRHARRDSYNLILVDWKMPQMDGVETTRQIRSITGDESTIIILTSYRWDDVLEEALEAGVDSFVSKPLFAATVLEEFKVAFRSRSAANAAAQKEVELAGRCILLAEDVDINAEIMEMVLDMREITCERAQNGRVAVDMFASKPVGYYDAVLMDIRMPEMDGLEATRIIRAMDREDARSIPIIALTANAFDEDVQRSLQAGLNAHLTKPIQPEVLFETLESLVENN